MIKSCCIDVQNQCHFFLLRMHVGAHDAHQLRNAIKNSMSFPFINVSVLNLRYRFFYCPSDLQYGTVKLAAATWLRCVKNI